MSTGRVVAGTWIVVLMTAYSCGGGGGGSRATATDTPVAKDEGASEPLLTSDEVLEPGPFHPGFVKIDLVDGSRPTPPNGDYEGADNRSLPTIVWYPTKDVPTDPSGWMEDGVPASEGGPWPLVVYNHGFMSNNHENDDLAALLATRGYVVAATLFPLSNTLAPGEPNAADVVNQPGDVRFVMDAVLARSADPADPMHGLVDVERIGLMGVSMGGLTSLITAFHDDYRDPRVKTVAGAAAPGCYLADGFFDDIRMPVMLVHGTLDDLVSYDENALMTYNAARAPKYLVTLDDATHTALAGLALGMVSMFENPDWIGCSALDGNQSITAEALAAMSEDFGGKDFDTVMTLCPAPCVNAGAFPPAMGAERQIRLLYLSLVAFTEAHLGGNDSYGRYLREGLGPQNDDVTVDFDITQ